MGGIICYADWTCATHALVGYFIFVIFQKDRYLLTGVLVLYRNRNYLLSFMTALKYCRTILIMHRCQNELCFDHYKS